MRQKCGRNKSYTAIYIFKDMEYHHRLHLALLELVDPISGRHGVDHLLVDMVQFLHPQELNHHLQAVAVGICLQAHRLACLLHGHLLQIGNLPRQVVVVVNLASYLI